jgi:N-acetylneuraminic acid mutarotase
MNRYIILVGFFFLLNASCNTDSEVSRWKKLTPFPGDKAFFTSVVIGEECYLFFGERNYRISWAETLYSNTIWKYNSKTEKWSELSSYEGQSRSRATGFSVLGKAYIIGGQSSEVDSENYNLKLNEVLKYNPDSDSWEMLNPFPGDSRSGGLSFVVNDQVYYGFGVGYPKTPLKDWWKYDPLLDEWVELKSFSGSLPNYYSDDYVYSDSYNLQHSLLVHFVFGNNIFVLSGATNSEPELWTYDVLEQDWKKIEDVNILNSEPELIYKVRSGSISFVFKEKCYSILGGWLNDVVYSGGLQEYDPITNTWNYKDIKNPIEGRAGAFAIVTTDGVVIGTDYSRYFGYELWKFRP